MKKKASAKGIQFCDAQAFEDLRFTIGERTSIPQEIRTIFIIHHSYFLIVVACSLERR